MKVSLYGIIMTVLLQCTAFAQDIPMTQFLAAPLVLNPAMTGNVMPDDMRFSVNFRSVPSTVFFDPYVTGIASFDIAALRDRLPVGDAIGFGMVGIWNRSPSGGAQDITAGVSLAYHKAFGLEQLQHISLGVQGYMIQKNLELDKLTYKDFYGTGPDNIIFPPTRQYDITDLSYNDFNAGVMYYGQIGPKVKASLGYSYYHLTQPVETFFSINHTVPARQTVHFAVSYDINELFMVKASGMFQNQTNNNVNIAGAAVGYLLNPGHDPDFMQNRMVYAGAWYRFGSAVSPYVELEWDKIHLGLCYDINSSDTVPNTGKKGIYEISVTYFRKAKSRVDYRGIWINPAL